MKFLRESLQPIVYNQERPGDTAELLRQVRHWSRWLVDSRYRKKHREIARLAALPRYFPTETSLLGTPMELVDAYSFLGMYREIFDQEMYSFHTENPRPYIIDGGANVGVSAMYFKSTYPRSQIVAFEPDAELFPRLERNLRNAGHADVDLHQRALWSSDTSLAFLSEGADGGRIATPGDDKERRFNPERYQTWRPPSRVQTMRLRPFLMRPVDFLKLDIEGAELEVLSDCADLLTNVQNIFVEYHSFASEPQVLHRVLSILLDAGFRIQIQQVTPTSPRPFISTYLRWGMDMQLNVFGTRSSRADKQHAVIAKRYRRYECLTMLSHFM